LPVCRAFPVGFGRVGPGVDGLKLVDVDLGVNGGGLQFLVTEQLLNEPDVCAAFEHVRGARVA